MATPPVPGVIDEEMCREGEERLHRPAGGAAAAPADGAVREVALRDAGSLALSFRNVLKIDNLVGFERLVKLELDNNIIERIENIGHLTSLETLDLSFNNISRISGLETLTKLTHLSLFNNRLTEVGGLDTLTALEVLSVGNNLIGDLSSVLYLRPFKRLHAVNFAGNPLCQEAEYRPYALAHLPRVKYLDYRMVDEQAVQAAKEQYQDRLQEMQEAEAAEEAAEAERQQRAERAAELAAANVGHVDAFRDEMLAEGGGDVGKLRQHASLLPLAQEFQAALNEAIDEYVAAALEIGGLKREELSTFSEAFGEAKTEGTAEAQRQIAQYRHLVKRAQHDAGASGLTPSQLGAMQEANGALYEALMDMEMSQVERYGETIGAFESAYEELSKRLQETGSTFFNRARELEGAFTQKLEAAASELAEEEAAREAGSAEDEAVPEEVRTLLGDRETLTNALTQAHDTRVAQLDAREDEARAREVAALQGTIERLQADEYGRNRGAVVEIWNLVHVEHKNELLELGAPAHAEVA